MVAEKVVVAALKGGVGNQLFQYAAAITVANRLGATVFVQHSATPGAALNELLGSEVRHAGPQTLRRIAVQLPSRGLSRRMQLTRRRVLSSRGKVLHIRQPSRESHSPMPELALQAASGIYLDGYFQHPTWFEPSLPIVAEQLRNRLEKIVSPEIVRGATVISFRRGDYVRLGWDLALGYYQNALELLPTKDGPIWVIGDDPLVVDLLRSWLDGRGVMTDDTPSPTTEMSFRDLALLMAADRVVMSNSTFCWWGVMAGDPQSMRTDRKIIAPASWVPVPGSTSLLRPSWKAIS